MYDHERSLVNEMKEAGEPFALVGVNCGDELETIKKAVKEKGLNWRSFFCGKDRTVSNEYGIKGFPTVIIIDAEGIVRSVAHGTQDDMIKKLLAEMK
ncbi:MAG: TlpA family protein disulfide reductase [Mariniblastus sp.]